MNATDRDRFGGYTKLRREATGFFRVDKIDGKWWFIDPEGCAFLSIGMNHITSSSLRYPDNIHIWRERYGASEERWVKEGVAACLKRWGFNTIGWTQEAVAGAWGARNSVPLHSPEWPHTHYQWAEMPYCFALPFAEIERWNGLAHYPDVFTAEFATWCDFVSREYCAKMADDPCLIGYYYCAMPGFISSDYVECWADGLDLDTAAGREKLTQIVAQYYRALHDAVRRYDTNHLILGDRYEGAQLVPDYLLKAAVPYIDVASVNQNGTFGQVGRTAEHIAAVTGKPVYLSDSGFWAPTELLDVSPGGIAYCPDQAARGLAYQQFAEAAFKSPYIVGWSWCAYLENRVRCAGVKNYLDEPYEDCVNLMREFNERVYEIVLEGSTPATNNGAD